MLMELRDLPNYNAKQNHLERNSKLATGTAFNLKGRIQLIRTDAYEADKGSNFNPAICIPDLMNPFQFLYNSIAFSSSNIQAAYCFRESTTITTGTSFWMPASNFGKSNT